MAASKLGQVLTIFEETREPLTARAIARQLAVSSAQLDGMLNYWVRKGRIREIDANIDCGTCGGKNGCPFVMAMPRSYALVTDEMLQADSSGTSCGLHQGCDCH